MPLPARRRIRRVCIVHLTGIGDVVHGLPLANDLKRWEPAPQVLWVAEPAPARVLDAHPAVDEVVVFRKGRGLAGAMELRDRLAGLRCDVTLNMQRYFKSILPTVFSGAPVRIGLAPSKTRDAVSWFSTVRLPDGPWVHTQDLLLGFRAPLGIEAGDPVRWRITFTPAERKEQTAFFAALPSGPVAALVLATANPKKDWPAERYAPLADELRTLGYTVLLVGGPGGREAAAAARVRDAAHHPPLDALGDSVRRMMWIVEGADLLVSPDTGPLHVAHALGTPVVGLYGHTNPWRVGPWRRFRDLVVDRYTDPGEEPDPSRYAPRDGRMDRITVQDVMERVERARETYGIRPRESAW